MIRVLMFVYIFWLCDTKHQTGGSVLNFQIYEFQTKISTANPEKCIKIFYYITLQEIVQWQYIMQIMKNCQFCKVCRQVWTWMHIFFKDWILDMTKYCLAFCYQQIIITATNSLQRLRVKIEVELPISTLNFI